MPTYGPDYSKVESFPQMVGQTLVRIEGKVGDDVLRFVAADGTKFVFWYEHDCCAQCRVMDIIGEQDDLCGSPILFAEEVSSEGAPPPEYPDSWTWTFYRFGTAKGTVTIRWLGESNGYYSEQVSFRVETPKQ